MAKLPRQLTSSFHLTHYAVFAYYFLMAYPGVLRPEAKDNARAQKLLFAEGFTSNTHEVETFIVIGLYFAYEFLHEIRSVDEGLHRLLLDAKIVTLILTFMTGNDYFMFGLVALYGSMAVLLNPPRYEGPSDIKSLNQESFDKIVLEDYDKDKPYLIMFGNLHDSETHFFEPIFSKLSMTYGDTVHFGSLDVAFCEGLAQGLLIENEHGKTEQLPVLICFHRGQEVQRLPEMDENGKVSKVALTKDRVVKHFELDQKTKKYLKDTNSKKNK